MRVARAAAVLLAAAVLAGCGEEPAGEGAAELWVTRDRGGEVVLTATVPAGISALEAVRREADVETRYGGRFVHSIDGIAGDVSNRRDWFWFVNGYEGDRSAAEYTLHDGDILWWDQRSWASQLRQPVVVGAFPEPFLHGWAGRRREAVVAAEPEDPLAQRIAKLIRARLGVVEKGENVVRLVEGVGMRAEVSPAEPGGRVTFWIGRDTAARLLDDPFHVRFRYEVR